ncbi:MAG: MFS transporter [Parachlamydiales bacterium]|nr:MFS transporter [Parachlamydiales bacterium]
MKKTKSILSLIVTQFFGAFNDNAWKIMVFVLATRSTVPFFFHTDNHEIDHQLKAMLTLFVFLIPMTLFSLPTGFISDRISKRTVIVIAKWLEVAIMLSSTIFLFVFPQKLVFSFFFLAAMGIQSAFFSPAKYGILPELLEEQDLYKGNGLIEMWTMLAIIIGTGMGPIFLAPDKMGMLPHLTAIGPLILTLLSIVGLIGAYFVPKVPAVRSGNVSVIKTIKSSVPIIKNNKKLLLAIVSMGFYWLFISLFGQNILVYAKELAKDLRTGELIQGLFPASFGVGVAIGALLSGIFSRQEIVYGMIPMGATGFAFFSILFSFLPIPFYANFIIIMFIGISSGLFIVPVRSIIQWSSPIEARGSIIAFSNFFNFIGVICGSLITTGLSFLGLSIRLILIISALLIAAAAIWSLSLLNVKARIIKIFYQIITFFYFDKIEVIDPQKLPDKKPILFVALHRNGATDGFVYLAALKPYFTYLVAKRLRKTFIGKIFFHGIEVIRRKDGEKDRGKTNIKAIEQCLALLKNGENIFIFPEGTSNLGLEPLPFQKGAARIAESFIAQEESLIIVPLGIRYSSPTKMGSRVKILVGDPFYFDHPSDKNTIHQQIEKALLELAVIGPSEEEKSPSYLSLQSLVESKYILSKNKWFALLTNLLTFPIIAVGFLVNLPPLFFGYLAGKIFSDARNVVSLWRIIIGFPVFFLWMALLFYLCISFHQPFLFLSYLSLTVLSAKIYGPWKMNFRRGIKI